MLTSIPPFTVEAVIGPFDVAASMLDRHGARGASDVEASVHRLGVDRHVAGQEHLEPHRDVTALHVVDGVAPANPARLLGGFPQRAHRDRAVGRDGDEADALGVRMAPGFLRGDDDRIPFGRLDGDRPVQVPDPQAAAVRNGPGPPE
jgi:hypothetical protein